MTVLAFAQDEAENPLASLTSAEVARLPFGAVELDQAGTVVNHIDTEPGDGEPAGQSMTGRDFFTQVAPWAGRGVVAQQFKDGVQGGTMNTVFDCAVGGLPYKVRIHLKTSPILGTFWIFIKKLTRT